MPKLPERIMLPWVKEAKPFDSIKQNNYDLYNSQRWRRYRALYLKRHPLCVHCEQEGKISQAVILDHIVPINQGGEIWDESNHQGLCIKHNAIKTAKDGTRKQVNH